MPTRTHQGPGWLRGPVFALALCLLPGLAAAAQESAPPRPPDVLLIVLDDVNDWVGYLGEHGGAKTPAIDALAARGRAFTNAHSVAPVCNPSRTSMLGGRRPAAKVDWEESLAGLLTFPEYFARRGYQVAVAGKVYHHPEGLDRFAEVYSVDHESLFLPLPKKPNIGFSFSGMAREDLLDWKALDLPPEEMPDHRIASWVCDRLQHDDEEPLMLAVGFATPHLPWYLPNESFAEVPIESVELPEVLEDDRLDLPPIAQRLALDPAVHREIVARGLWDDAVQAYLASVTFADAQVGRVLEALERSPRRDRTVVVLTSDHGYHLGEKMHWRKFSLWEEATHVPLVIAGPGIEPGRCSRPVDLLMLYPTLCSLAGLPVPEHVEGADLSPLLQDPGAPWDHAAVTVYKQHRALRTERWRYIRYGNGGEELYDHDADPHEHRNLASSPEYREVRERLAAQLQEMTGG